MAKSLDDITIGDAKRLAAMFSAISQAETPTPSTDGPQPGDKVIVRSRDAGVQYGVLKSYQGSTVHLTDARQMWSWTAKEGGTLLDCAQKGVLKGKFSAPADAVTVIGACAIIATTPDAQETLEAQKWSS